MRRTAIKVKPRPKPRTDYIAVILIGCGSSHGRSTDRDKAIAGCHAYLSDWKDLFAVKGHAFTAIVLDVFGYGEVQWSHRGFRGVNEKTGEWEDITREPEYVEVIG